MDVVRKGVDWLQRYRQRQMVEECQYVQDGVLTTGVNLTLAHDASNQETDEVIFSWRDQDFLVSPSHFAEKGLQAPRRGDRIIRNVGTTQIEYDVIPTDTEPHYRPMSRYQLGWRIHAKRIRTGANPASS